MGEVGEVKAGPSGHMYFTLKEAPNEERYYAPMHSSKVVYGYFSFKQFTEGKENTNDWRILRCF